MREPSGHGIRGPARAADAFFALLALRRHRSARATPARRPSRASCATPATSTSSPPAARLRTQDNNGNACLVGATSTHERCRAFPPAPPSATPTCTGVARAARPTPAVTLNGTHGHRVAHLRATYTGVTPSTAVLRRVRQRHQHRLVTGNGNYTFGGLTVVTGSPHCDVSAVVSGWSAHRRLRVAPPNGCAPSTCTTASRRSAAARSR